MNLPIYKAKITDAETGMFTISLVDSPAVESDFLVFEKQQPMNFKIENEEKRIVTGVVMRVDHPIYRIGSSGYEYYIMFDRPTVELMAEKWLAEGMHNRINLQHNPEAYVDGIYLKEVYFKDVERNINPQGYEDIEDGSLFASYKVLNDDVWSEIKKGAFKGFSLEGVFNMEPEDKKADIEDEIIDILEKIIEKNRKK